MASRPISTPTPDNGALEPDRNTSSQELNPQIESAPEVECGCFFTSTGEPQWNPVCLEAMERASKKITIPPDEQVRGDIPRD